MLCKKTWKGTHIEVQRSLAVQTELVPPLSGLLRPQVPVTAPYSLSCLEAPGLPPDPSSLAFRLTQRVAQVGIQQMFAVRSERNTQKR